MRDEQCAIWAMTIAFVVAVVAVTVMELYR